MDNSTEQLEEQLEELVEENADDVDIKQSEHNPTKRQTIDVPCKELNIQSDECDNNIQVKKDYIT